MKKSQGENMVAENKNKTKENKCSFGEKFTASTTNFPFTNGTVPNLEDIYKWSSKEDTELQQEVLSVFEKVRQERKKTEQEINEAVKRFEWSTGIKVIKLDFETSRENINPKAKLVLDRI